MTYNSADHKTILTKILKAIAEDPHLATRLAFKGGTAAFLLYNLTRDSVDLDFDLTEPTAADEVYERLGALLAKHGTMKETTKGSNGFYYLISYHDKRPGAQNVKVDVNLRDFKSTYEIQTFSGISMKVMVKPDMVAHKLCALLNRIGDANRDIYDVWFFLANDWPINREIVEARTGTSFKVHLQSCIDALTKFNNADILKGIGELIDAKQKAWAKAKLLSETIFLLGLRLQVELDAEKRAAAK